MAMLTKLTMAMPTITKDDDIIASTIDKKRKQRDGVKERLGVPYKRVKVAIESAGMQSTVVNIEKEGGGAK